MVALWNGPLRRSELLEKIHATLVTNGWSHGETRYLHDRVMNQTLHRLERYELVEHSRDDATFPPVSVYRLSEAARELLKTLEAPLLWAERYDALIKRAQQRQHDDPGH